jgi:hypothetical protein
MLTDKELSVLLKHIDKQFEDKWQQIKNLELKVEELSNGKGEGPKTNKGGSKRVQQTKEDS